MTALDTASLLRMEVARLRARESRRRFDTVVYVGHLGRAAASRTVPPRDPVLDAGTRTEVVSLLLEDGALVGEEACAWMARAGEPSLQDEDLAWLSASSRAFGSLGCRLDGFWSVTRTGWLDVRTGQRRTWKRLRV